MVPLCMLVGFSLVIEGEHRYIPLLTRKERDSVGNRLWIKAVKT
jgi:hypothetical protein